MTNSGGVGLTALHPIYSSRLSNATFTGTSALIVAASSGLKLSGDFTIQGWSYLMDTNRANTHTVLELGYGLQGTSTASGVLLRNDSQYDQRPRDGATTQSCVFRCTSTARPSVPQTFCGGVRGSAVAPPCRHANVWNYFVLNRINDTVNFFVNGTQRLSRSGITGTDRESPSPDFRAGQCGWGRAVRRPGATPERRGADLGGWFRTAPNPSHRRNGCLADLRIVKGVALSGMA